jgi:hypothetical protein
VDGADTFVVASRSLGQLPSNLNALMFSESVSSGLSTKSDLLGVTSVAKHSVSWG